MTRWEIYPNDQLPNNITSISSHRPLSQNKYFKIAANLRLSPIIPLQTGLIKKPTNICCRFKQHFKLKYIQKEMALDFWVILRKIPCF